MYIKLYRLNTRRMKINSEVILPSKIFLLFDYCYFIVFIPEPTFFCERFSTGFVSHSLHVQHMTKHTEIDTKCSLCSKDCFNIKSWESLKITHSRLKIINSVEQLSSFVQIFLKTPFHCAICNKSFIRRDRLTKHEIIHKSGNIRWLFVSGSLSHVHVLVSLLSNLWDNP